MADKSRIPRSAPLFNSYIVNTTNYLLAGTAPNTNAARLGVLDSEVAKWSALASKWGDVFLLYSDKKYTRTTDVKDQMLSIIDDFVKLDQTSRILDRIAASPNVTVTDLEVFNIKAGILKKATRTIPTTRLTDKVVADIQALGGGSFAIKAKSSSGGGTAIIDGADSVQCVYKVGTTPPVSVDDDGMKTNLSTKASFSMDLGTENSGKTLYVYFRWFNTKHPELAGPWSILYVTVIL